MKVGLSYRKENVNGFWVRTVYASEVESIICTLSGTSKLLELKAEEKQYEIGIPYDRPDQRIVQKICINQFPIMLNTATTGHKLQGQTVESLLVNDWFYGSNWPYVVLSRTRTRMGLFLREELDSSKDYSVDPNLIFHLALLRQRISILH